MPMRKGRWLLLLVVLYSCGEVKVDGVYTQVMVHYAGDPAVDGCGWLLKGDTVVFKPVDLPKKYQRDSLRVEILYRVLEERSTCGFSVREEPLIEIADIRTI
jgi:hypothetical protein